ncbi:MAG: transposase [Proteobacteria bacterium]|nr:transposase [Pseudomonadota bacterium]
MKKQNIYRNQSQEILSLFESAGERNKAMCIPMDYAKKDHVVMFCNGNGDILRKPFSVKNSLEGKNYLVDQVKKSCQHRGIKLQHVFFGGEDCGSYADNFISALRSDSWVVAGVNACDAKKHRDNKQASTDILDLLGICKMLLSCKGNCSPAQTGIYWNLRMLVRQRRKLVQMATGVKRRIHFLVDQIFPGFLDEKKSGIFPFSKGSLALMGNRFSVHQIRQRSRSTLSRLLARNLVHHADHCAEHLQKYTSQVLQPPAKYIATLQLALQQQVKLYICLQENIQQLEKEIAEHLAQTPGAFLTSIRGIGIVLAAGVCAEIGDPDKQKSLSQIVSYAGIVPRIKQTGGVQGKTQVKKVGKRCNRILKDYVVRSGYHIGINGPEELKLDHKRRGAQGQHADFGMSRRYLRMAMCLMRTSQTYLPKNLRDTRIPMEERAQYYVLTWSTLRDKWKKKGALEFAFDKDRLLGQWRNVVQDLYGIELEL